MTVLTPILSFAASLLFMISGLSASAWAAGGADRGTLGIALGPALRSQDGIALGFEIKGGLRFLPSVATNAFFWRASSGADISAGGSSLSSSHSMTAFGVEALYGFAASYWSGGIKLGLMKNSISGKASGTDEAEINLDDSQSALFLAPTLTYEIPVGSFSLGAEVAYFYCLSDSVPKALSTMALARYRF